MHDNSAGESRDEARSEGVIKKGRGRRGRSLLEDYSSAHIWHKEDLLRVASGTSPLMNKRRWPRLPTPPFLMVDRIMAMNTDGGRYSKGLMDAEFDISPDLWFFKCHFLSDSVMPGCLQLDALWQMAGVYAGALGYEGHGRALSVGSVKFMSEVTPANKLVSYRLEIRRIVELDLVVLQADGDVHCDGRLCCVAKGLRVGILWKAPLPDGRASVIAIPTD